MLWQHSRSSAVSLLSGSKHAINGRPNKLTASNVPASLLNNLTCSVYRGAGLNDNVAVSTLRLPGGKGRQSKRRYLVGNMEP
jgi:hypothetical protein